MYALVLWDPVKWRDGYVTAKEVFKPISEAANFVILKWLKPTTSTSETDIFTL